ELSWYEKVPAVADPQRLPHTSLLGTSQLDTLGRSSPEPASTPPSGISRGQAGTVAGRTMQVRSTSVGYTQAPLVLGHDQVPAAPLQVQAFWARMVLSAEVLAPQFLVQVGLLLQAVPSSGAGEHMGSAGGASLPASARPPWPLPP